MWAQAGVHSGDSACSIPPQTIAKECLDTIREWTPKLAKALKVVGLINIQYCIQDNQVCLLPTETKFTKQVVDEVYIILTLIARRQEDTRIRPGTVQRPVEER